VQHKQIHTASLHWHHSESSSLLFLISYAPVPLYLHSFPTRRSSDLSFIAPNLPAGNYAVTVSKAGFRTYKQTGIRLESAATFVVSATLEVGCPSACKSGSRLSRR